MTEKWWGEPHPTKVFARNDFGAGVGLFEPVCCEFAEVAEIYIAENSYQESLDRDE